MKGYDKLYSLMSGVYLNGLFEIEDVEELANFFFNLATNGFYYYIVEKNVFIDNLTSMEERIKHLEVLEIFPVCRYIPIKEEYFLTFLLKCLFEWEINVEIKRFYLLILE